VSLEVDDERDSPEAQWRIAVPGSDLAGIVARLARPVGRIVAVEVAERTPSGRVRRLRVVGHRGAALVEARALRRALGPRVLRSTLFEVRSEGDRVVFTGAGYGHGVGMSQWAARAMARRGAPYRAILARFYPGAVLRRLPHAVPDSAQTGMSLAAGAGLR
jgi:stage II sporulation protein D